MIKDKINDIINTLIHLTKTGNLIWVEEALLTNNKRAYQRTMQAFGEDGTLYEVEVAFLLSNETWQLEGIPSMHIKNQNLPNKRMFASGSIYPAITELRNLIMGMYCRDMKPTTSVVEDALDSILKGINISNYRETRINDILDGDTKK